MRTASGLASSGDAGFLDAVLAAADYLRLDLGAVFRIGGTARAAMESTIRNASLPSGAVQSGATWPGSFPQGCRCGLSAACQVEDALVGGVEPGHQLRGHCHQSAGSLARQRAATRRPGRYFRYVQHVLAGCALPGKTCGCGRLANDIPPASTKFGNRVLATGGPRQDDAAGELCRGQVHRATFFRSPRQPQRARDGQAGDSEDVSAGSCTSVTTALSCPSSTYFPVAREKRPSKPDFCSRRKSGTRDQ
jgi:hypothetical protein